MMNSKTQSKKIQALILVLIFFTQIIFSQTLDIPENNAICVPTEPILVFSGTSGSSTVEILDCSTIDLSAYSYQNTFDVDFSVVNDDLSGITYNPLTNTLFAVTNGGNLGSVFEAIYEISLNGNIINTFNLADADDLLGTPHFDDTEGIVHLYARTFAVVEEKRGRIAILDLPTTSADIYYSDADIIQLPGTWSNAVNNGLEGISYNPLTNQLHVVKESNLKKYYTIDMPTVFPANNPTLTERDLTVMNIQEATGAHYMGLTSAFAGTGVANNRLIVDEAGMKLVEVDVDYQIISEIPLPARKYEGVTMDNNGTIYLTQEPNKIHVYTRPAWPSVIHSATVSQGGYIVPIGVLDESTEYCWRVHNNGNTSATHSFTTIGTRTICATISGGENDVEELLNQDMYISSSDLELIHDPNPDRLYQKIGLRYEDLGIPQGATILSAHLQFTTDEITSGTVNLTIQGEDADHSTPFTLTNGNLSARPTTQAAATWSPPDWQLAGERGAKQQTPDLTPILQEIVDRNGFDQNSAVAFIISGSSTNKRIAKSYEGSPALAPQLCVTFTPEACGGETCVEANISLWLEGAYDPTGNTMRTRLHNQNVLPAENIGTNPVVAGQPYFNPPWNYPGTEGTGWQINDYNSAVVDWVLVSFRKEPAANSEVFKAAALLHNDGNIHFLEQCALSDNLMQDPLYVVVDHRNHLVAMSHIAMPPAVTLNTNGDEYITFTYDFRQQDSYNSAGFGQKELPNGQRALFAGDINGDCDINGADNSIRSGQNGIFGQYIEGDVNMDADVNGSDRGVWSPNSGYSSGVPK